MKKPAPKAISSPTTQRSALQPGQHSPTTFKYLAVVRGKFDVDDGVGFVSTDGLSPRLISIIRLQDQEDLCFKKDEVLFVTERNSANWWTAKNHLGCTGKIPVNYVELVSIYCLFMLWQFSSIPFYHFAARRCARWNGCIYTRNHDLTPDR